MAEKCFDDDENCKTPAEHVMDHISRGNFTDCSFLVGVNNEIEMVHGLKANLAMMSEFMESMFRSPLCPSYPIRISNIDLTTFKHVISYVHALQLPDDLPCLEAINLAVAADYLILKPTGHVEDHCLNVIEKKIRPRHVWILLDGVFSPSLNHITYSCLTLINHRTTMCLIHESFLEASSQSVNKMLQQGTLVLTEGQLLEHCLRWAAHQPQGLRKAMRSLLSNLRLCSLKAPELSRLPEFLDASEMMAVKRQVNKTCRANFHLPDTLCQTIKPRRPLRYERTCVFITQTMMELCNLARTDLSIYCNFIELDGMYEMENYLTIPCTKDIYITKISGIAPMTQMRHRDIGNLLDDCQQESSGSYNVLFIGKKVGTFSADKETWEVRLPEPLFIQKSSENYYMHVGVQFREHQRFIRRIPEEIVNCDLTKNAHSQIFENIACVPDGKLANLHFFQCHSNLSNHERRKCPDFVFVKSVSYCFVKKQYDLFKI